tara:strand:+ start:6379 stop:7173 length:795 start_codon:yes stop_codon:yes gene_type:complete
MTGLQLGPFVFGADRVIALVAALSFLTCLWLWNRLDRRRNLHGTAVIVGWLVAARAGFVISHWDVYAAHPLDILAVWQVGFLPAAGLAGVGVVILFTVVREWRNALPLMMATGVAALAAGITPHLLPAGGASNLPHMSFANIDGAQTLLPGDDARPLVVNLWATWCPPCRREMPMMMQVAKDTPDARIVFANQGETLTDVRRFLEVQNLKGDGVLQDPNMDLMRHFEALGLPTTLFFDADGNLTEAITGEVSRAALTAGIQSTR